MDAETTPEAGTDSTARSSMRVMIWTVFSRVIGLARVLVIGAVLGPTYVANIFQAGYVLGGNVFTLLAGPVLCMVVVPPLVHSMVKGDLSAARVLLSRITGRLIVLSSLGALALALVSPLLAWLLVIAVPAPERSHALLLGIVLIVSIVPQVPLLTMAEIGLAAQQARGRFALATAAPAAESVGTIATVALVAWWFGAGLEVAQTPVAMMVTLGLGTTVSVAAHAGLQIYGMARAGLLARPRWDWRADDDAVEAIRSMVRSIPVSACPAITNYGVAVVAATVPGGVVVVQLSYQVFYALSFLGARAVSMVALPRLAAEAAGTQVARFAAAWRECLFFATLSATPPLVLLLAFSGPTTELLANGELRQAGVIGALSGCLMIVAVAQLVGGLHDLGRQTLFARRDDRTPPRASLLALGVVLAVTLGSLLLPPGEWRLYGLITAILCGEVAAGIMVMRRVRKAIVPEHFIAMVHIRAWAACTVAMAPGVAIGWWVLHHFALPRLALLPVLIAVAVVAVAGLGVVLRGVLPGIRADAEPAPAAS
jgi:peptidoglycan biosynthesis protein MviN/MurJ (putative lipid II flippase)